MQKSIRPYLFIVSYFLRIVKWLCLNFSVMIVHMIKPPTQQQQAVSIRTSYDMIVYFFALTTPLFELPQAYLIFSSRDASNVSAPTWIYFSIASIVFLSYAVKKRIRPLILAYSLYLVIEIFIVVGIIRYG